MKTIAADLGVSLNTVHKAIAGKPGISASTKQRIMAYARKCGYRRNEGASNLRRKECKIIACLPSRSGIGRFFYADLWKGCSKFEHESSDAGLSFEMIPFELGGYAVCLRRVLDRVLSAEMIRGLLAFVPASSVETDLIRQISDLGVAVELVMGDKPETGRVGAVIADYRTAGRLMAEQAHNILCGAPDTSEILLLAGDVYTDAHYLVSRAFHEGLSDIGDAYVIDDLQGAHGELESLHAALLDRLVHRRPQLVCCVFAVGSEELGDALRSCGLAGSIPVIASDVFEGSVESLKEGTFTNLVFKDPVKLAHDAAKALGDYILWGTRSELDVQSGPIELVFKSNLEHYQHY